MGFNEFGNTKHCKFCEAIVPVKSLECPFCKKNISNQIPEKLILLNLIEVKKVINEAFFRIESFMQGALNSYQYFGFDDAFTKLFFEVKNPENFTYENCKLIGEYWKICGQIWYDFEKGNFSNEDAYKNDEYTSDCHELRGLVWNRLGEFCEFLTQDEIEEAEKKISISTILKKDGDLASNSKGENESEGVIEAGKYISYYGLLSHFPVYWDIKLGISNGQFLKDNPEHLLNKRELLHLHSNETFSLAELLSQFTDGIELIRMLRQIFDDYRAKGGNPLEWLYFTFKNVSLNPHNYKGEHIGLIEKSLIQWIENFTNQPFDSLAMNVKYLNEKDIGLDKKNKKILGPVFALFCSIVHQSGLLTMGYDESNENYCQRVSEYFTINVNPKKARQYFSSIMDIKETDKNLKKVKELILANLPGDAKSKIDTFLRGKLSLYA